MVLSGEDNLTALQNNLTLLQTPDQLKRWGLQAKRELQPTYLQQHCLDRLEQLLKQQAAYF